MSDSFNRKNYATLSLAGAFKLSESVSRLTWRVGFHRLFEERKSRTGCTQQKNGHGKTLYTTTNHAENLQILKTRKKFHGVFSKVRGKTLLTTMFVFFCFLCFIILNCDRKSRNLVQCQSSPFAVQWVFRAAVNWVVTSGAKLGCDGLNRLYIWAKCRIDVLWGEKSVVGKIS